MKSKSKINGFKPFTGYDDIGDGLKIPTGRTVEPNPVEPKRIMAKQPIQPFSKMIMDNKAFVPMINSVPTIQPINMPKQEPKFKGLTRKQKQRILPEDLDLVEFASQKTKQDKIMYLAMRGWSLKVVKSGNTHYHQATRYINRKKKRVYLGSINKDMNDELTVKSITITDNKPSI